MVDDSLARAQARVDPTTGLFRVFSWAELRSLIDAGDLAALTRTPEALKGYEAWKTGTMAAYGTVENYILRERLGWSLPIVPASVEPFLDPMDWKCLKNDFPYAVEDGITHLVVWTKHPLVLPSTEPSAPSTSSNTMADKTDGQTSGITTPQLEDFIYRRLFRDVERENIQYFTNPPSLKSIHNLEHFHVLLKDQEWEKYVS